jgi:hypothetical protein
MSTIGVMPTSAGRVVPSELRARLRDANLSELERLSGVSRNSLINMRDRGRAMPSTIARVTRAMTEVPADLESKPTGRRYNERITSIITNPGAWDNRPLHNEERILQEIAKPMTRQQRLRLLSCLFAIIAESSGAKT